MIVSNQANEKRCLKFMHKVKELLDFIDTMTTADAETIQIAVKEIELEEKKKEIKFEK